MIYGVRECYATTYRHRMSLTIETYCNVEILFDNRDSNEEKGETNKKINNNIFLKMYTFIIFHINKHHY